MQSTVAEDAELTLLYTEFQLCKKFTSQDVSKMDCFEQIHIPFQLVPHPKFSHILFDKYNMQMHTKHGDKKCKNQHTGLKTAVEPKSTLQSEPN